MDNREIIQNSLVYIEENLKAEITAKDLADLSGFSVFYYYRLFQGVVGMPVMQYILHRRLINAIYDISCGNKKINVALEYGFSSYASFYKAFYREIGYTPSEFLNNFKAEKPAKTTLVKDGYTMITHKKLSAILENWNIADKTIKDVYYNNSGRRNENAFYIGEDYVIKVTRDLGRIKKQIELAGVMKSNELYAIEIIPTISGKDYVTANNLYFYLTKRLKGEHINPHDFYESKDYSLAQIVGENIAKLHLGLETIEAVVDEVNVFENVVKWALPKAKRFIDIPEHIEKSYSDSFGAIYDFLPKQIIHRDINPGNQLRTEFKKEMEDLKDELTLMVLNNEFLTEKAHNGLQYTLNQATITFDKKNKIYRFTFEKHFKIISDIVPEYYQAQFYANKFITDKDKAYDFYSKNPISWQQLNVRAIISYKKKNQTKFTKEEWLEVINICDNTFLAIKKIFILPTKG